MLGPEHERRATGGAARVIGVLAVLTLAACSILGSSVDGFSSCPAGSGACAGLCVDVATNTQNCGACGVSCRQGEACVGGRCEVACPGGQATCGGLCYELANDPKHCGTCETTCKNGEVCGNGQCGSNCPMGQNNCNGSCADLQTDSAHCGNCETTCSATQECVGGQCVIACRTQLNQGITDPWGWSWDGLERAATNWDQAKTTCEAFRGRLPTASEAYRVSATQSATVGQTIHTNPLWSLVPYGGAQHISVRLSDAATAGAADTTNLNYRCVCAPPLPDVYSGRNCFGPNTAPCLTALGGEGKKVNLDAQDRAPLHKGGAIWECAFHRGRLPQPRMLAEAIQQGIPAGSGQWLHLGDEVTYQYDALLNWTNGTGFTYGYTAGANSLSWNVTTTLYPFRCVGESVNAGPNPGTVAGSWVSPQTRRTSELNDSAAAAYVAAADECWNRGGHLPSSTELAELVAQGLPNGSNALLWTSDQTGYNSVQFTMAALKWSGVDTRALYSHNGGAGDLTWAYKHTNTAPYRCIYYPIDATYMGPAAASCAGGCATITLPGTSGAKVWIDAFDRAPATTVTDAVDKCRLLGGHLSTQRDLFEAVRKGGLSNGTDAWLWSADPEVGDPSQGYMLFGVAKWTGAQPAFDDLYPTYTTWSAPTDPRVYRCMWTNELR